ncbi:MAG TPA: pyridoxamine 5'-phosphate oxidase [Nocardioidaceae bacterium]|nr:pyridoxamine 5'-phosphate oxidase [Nocardioidaceae bacterium]
MSTSPSPDLGRLRREYGDRGLDVPDLEPDPIAMFRRWLDDTVQAGVHEPNAMVVATVSADGRPSARLVLLKGLDERGFVFYTNLSSRKGEDIAANPAVSLLFPWHDLQRQVRVEGTASGVDAEESEAYFASRPRESQLGAWASPQSQVVPSRSTLDERYGGVLARFADADAVPLPPFWGGFRVAPEAVEFWQGRKGRMHDRLVYRRTPDDPREAGWAVARLAP